MNSYYNIFVGTENGLLKGKSWSKLKFTCESLFNSFNSVH